jgi:hypothetical protein
MDGLRGSDFAAMILIVYLLICTAFPSIGFWNIF